MTTTLTSAAATRRPARTLLALSSMAATAALIGAAPAGAAPITVGSGDLTWSVPRETSPYTLAGYAASIGSGSVDATAPASGASITPTSLPAAGAGVTYPFDFPVTTTGTTGTYDPDTKKGQINFSGTLTFTAHGGTFFSVVDPSIVFDVPQSARLVASGVVTPAQGASDPTPVAYGTASPARQTVFALDPTAATATVNPDGSYTISGLAPVGTPQSAPTSFLSTNTVFDSIRTVYGVSRPNQGFSVSFAPVGATVATPTPTPTPTPEATPAPYTPQTPTPAVTATPTPAPIATPIAAPAVQLFTIKNTIKTKPFGKTKVQVSIRKSGKGQKSIGKGTLQGNVLKIKLPKGTKLKGKYVLSRTSGSKKLPKSATVTIAS